MSETRPYRNIAGDHLTQNLHHAKGQHQIQKWFAPCLQPITQRLMMTHDQRPDDVSNLPLRISGPIELDFSRPGVPFNGLQRLDRVDAWIEDGCWVPGEPVAKLRARFRYFYFFLNQTNCRLCLMGRWRKSTPEA